MAFSLAISNNKVSFSKNRLVQLLFALFLIFWISTFVGTSDVKNWFLENTLVFIFLAFLIYSYRFYQFSDLSYLLMFVYLCLHIYGAQHTYAENPFGYWLKDQFNWERNHYDRIVHFSFGFLLAYPMRETFLMWKKFPVWVSWWLPIEITLSISGIYELVEWAVADIFFKEQGAAYLGTQGDIWDAQKDMFLATIGAIIATSIVSSLKSILKIGIDEK